MKRIAVIGGGTGTFTVLSGLKKHPVDLSAIVSMADDGGSTGVLRDELGVLPPGDVRQCLIALSESDDVMRKLMSYRFSNGSFSGHSFGNILLSTLEKTSGSFDEAVARASEILRLRGRVIPVTLSNTRLLAKNGSDKIIRGERFLGDSDLTHLSRIWLEPKARANKKAVDAILDADLVVIGPGDFYASLVPNLLVAGIRNALRKTSARVAYVCNLVTKPKHTDGWTVEDFANSIERYIGASVNAVVYNKRTPTEKQLARYAREGEKPVAVPKNLPKKYIGASLVRAYGRRMKGDPIVRTLIRHDSDKLATILLSLV